MNRTTAAALIAAGVVGLVGGTVSAVVRGDHSPGTGGPSTAPTTRSEQPQPAATVLYAGDGKVVDGKRTITWTAPHQTPTKLVRTSTGYLLSFATSPQEPAFELWAVDTEGQSTLVAKVAGTWDLDATKSRIVGSDLESGKVIVWSLEGTAEATWRLFTGRHSPVWVGERVMVSPVLRNGTLPQLFWDPATEKQTTTRNVGFSNLTSSPDQLLAGGQVDSEGAGSNNEGNYCLASQKVGDTSGANQWYTCDWRSNVDGVQYSPDSAKVMAIPAQSDGFGPGVFGVFSATDGPKAGVSEIKAPGPTLGAEWLDEGHLVVYGASDYNLDDKTAMVIRTCDLSGKCAEVAHGAEGEKLVVASTT
ncbi:MAG: hypothetical protein ABIN79_15755 [Marmoricola sp.]